MSGSSQYSRGISARSRSSPGARIIQLGEFKGLRIDRAPESHCRGLVRKSYEEKAPSSLLLEFRNDYEEYLDWLDKRRDPFSAKVWFGEYEGYEIRDLYNDRTRWKWLVKNTIWGDALRDMEHRWIVWKIRHALRQRKSVAATQRAAPVIVNPVGEKLDQRDDGPASDVGEPYALDDFVVPDGQSSEDEYREVSEDEMDSDHDSSTSDAIGQSTQELIDENRSSAPLDETTNSTARKRARPTKRSLRTRRSSTPKRTSHASRYRATREKRQAGTSWGRAVVGSDADVSCSPSQETAPAIDHGPPQKRRRLAVISSDSEI